MTREIRHNTLFLSREPADFLRKTMLDDFIRKLPEKTVVTDKDNYVVANLSRDTVHGDMRGWLCGHFYPKDSVFHRNDVEICFKSIAPGFQEDLHYHLCSFEFLMILKGKVEYEIDGDRHVLTPGMFYMLRPGSTERIVVVHEEILVMAVRLPSVPGNKMFVNEGKDI